MSEVHAQEYILNPIVPAAIYPPRRECLSYCKSLAALGRSVFVRASFQRVEFRPAAFAVFLSLSCSLSFLLFLLLFLDLALAPDTAPAPAPALGFEGA